MQTLTILAAIGAAILIVVGIVVSRRRSRSTDLGSVSAAWTTQHSVGYRSGDGSTS